MDGLRTEYLGDVHDEDDWIWMRMKATSGPPSPLQLLPLHTPTGKALASPLLVYPAEFVAGVMPSSA